MLNDRTDAAVHTPYRSRVKGVTARGSADIPLESMRPYRVRRPTGNFVLHVMYVQYVRTLHKYTRNPTQQKGKGKQK
jgi:hypothetical protein